MTELLPLNTSPLPVKLRIEDYLLLDRSGAFDDYARTELIEGDVYFMNAQHRPHARLKTGLYDVLRDALRATSSPLRALIEASVALSDYDVPEPDIVLTSEPDGEGLVPLNSVALIIEVADTTLAGDLSRKARIYARAGIAEYWVADVNTKVIHKMWSPEGDVYAQQRECPFGEPITAATIATLSIETRDLG